MIGSRTLAALGIVVAAALLPAVPAAVAPSLAPTAHATDPGEWGPGDLIRFPDGIEGEVDANGRTVTIYVGATPRWSTGLTVDQAAQQGGRKIGG